VFDGEDEDCDNRFTVWWEYQVIDKCGNSDIKRISFEVDDETAPELDHDERYCLYPTYGQDWGFWAAYDVQTLFKCTDNCDGELMVPTDFICNATDKTETGHDVVFNPHHNAAHPEIQRTDIDECRFVKIGGKWLVYLKVEREEPTGANNDGRMYHIYATVSDNCGNICGTSYHHYWHQ
jgi:hypothetical protein